MLIQQRTAGNDGKRSGVEHCEETRQNSRSSVIAIYCPEGHRGHTEKYEPRTVGVKYTGAYTYNTAIISVRTGKAGEAAASSARFVFLCLTY